MANLQVTRSGKDTEGDITALCGSWGRSSKVEAIRDIENNAHRYYVQTAPGSTVDVIVVTRNNRKHLRTDPDWTKKNNLDNLPDC